MSSYTMCHGCHNYYTSRGLSNHQRGCGALLAKMAAESASAARISEQKRMIDAQAKMIQLQQQQIAKLSQRPTQVTNIVNNTMNINILATEKVASAITDRFNSFNNALTLWIEHQKSQNEPLKASNLQKALEDAPDKSFLDTFEIICGKKNDIEVDVKQEELEAANSEAIEKHQNACIESSLTTLRQIKQ